MEVMYRTKIEFGRNSLEKLRGSFREQFKPSFYLSVPLTNNQKWSWQCQHEAILRYFRTKCKFTTQKNQKFCETSSQIQSWRDFLNFSFWNIHNEAIRWDFLLGSKLHVELTPCQCNLRFFHPISRKCRACHEKVRLGSKCFTCHGKAEDLMLPLGRSAPRPSEGHVSRTAPAPRNSSLQMVFKGPNLPSFFQLPQTAAKPPRLVHFFEGQNPLRLPLQTAVQRLKVVQTCCVFHCLKTSTSKSAPELRYFSHVDLQICFAPQQRALFDYLNF